MSSTYKNRKYASNNGGSFANCVPRAFVEDDKPIKALEGQVNGEKVTLDIPRRKKSTLSLEETDGAGVKPYLNGDAVSNGKRKADEDLELSNSPKKRTAAEVLDGELPAAKRGKIEQNGGPPSDDKVVIDDGADGAIVIDDD